MTSLLWLRLSALTLAVIAMMAVAGCNTMEGVGEDAEDVGEEIQDAAD